MSIFYIDLKNITINELHNTLELDGSNKSSGAPDGSKLLKKNTELFVDMEFDASFKQVITKPMKAPWKWDGVIQTILYGTSSEDVSRSKLIVKVLIKHSWFLADMLIGIAEIDFHTIFTGPQHYELQMKPIHGIATLLVVSFELVVHELVENVRLAMSSIDITEVCEEIILHRADDLLQRGCEDLFVRMLYIDPLSRQWHPEAIPFNIRKLRSRLLGEENGGAMYRNANVSENGVCSDPKSINYQNQNNNFDGSVRVLRRQSKRIIIPQCALKLDLPMTVHEFLQSTLHLVLWASPPQQGKARESSAIELGRMILPIYGTYDVQHRAGIQFKETILWSDYMAMDASHVEVDDSDSTDIDADQHILAAHTFIIGSFRVDGGPRYVQMPFGKYTHLGIEGRQHVGFYTPKSEYTNLHSGSGEIMYCYLVHYTMNALMNRIISHQGYSHMQDHVTRRLPHDSITSRYKFIDDLRNIEDFKTWEQGASLISTASVVCALASDTGTLQKDHSAFLHTIEPIVLDVETNLIDTSLYSHLSGDKKRFLLNKLMLNRQRYAQDVSDAAYILSLCRLYDRESTSWQVVLRKQRHRYRQLQTQQAATSTEMYVELEAISNELESERKLFLKKKMWIRTRMQERIASYMYARCYL